MAQKYKMIRVTVETAGLLAVEQGVLNYQKQLGNLTEVYASDRFGVSLDETIRVLIKRNSDHRERSRKKVIDRAKELISELDANSMEK